MTPHIVYRGPSISTALRLARDEALSGMVVTTRFSGDHKSPTFTATVESRPHSQQEIYDARLNPGR